MSENTQNFKVEFPNKINVTSPELDAVSQSTSTISQILSKHIQEIVKPLQTLYELPKLLAQISKVVTENFTNLFRANVESDVLNRQATIKVVEKKAGFIEDHIERKKNHVSTTIDRIQEDYRGYFLELAHEQNLFLEKLDNHAYDLISKVYPKYIQEKFSFQSLPSVDFLTDHISAAAFARSAAINMHFANADNQVLNFMRERDEAYNRIEDYHTDSQAGYYQLPCYVIEVEDNSTGEISQKYIFPWEHEDELADITNTIIPAIDNLMDLLDKNQGDEETKDQLMESIKVYMKASNLDWDRFQNDCIVKLERA